MKMHWSPRSPYVRKVMIVAHEKGIVDRIETQRNVVNAFNCNPVVAADNPLVKVPTLILDNGEALFDSPVIAEYFDSLSPQNPLVPPAGPDRIATLRRQALGDGLMDLLNGWRAETMRPDVPQSPAYLKACEQKIRGTFQFLEKLAPSFDAKKPDLGHIAIGVAICYQLFRFEQIDWQKTAPNLLAWFNEINARPSFVATAFVEG